MPVHHRLRFLTFPMRTSRLCSLWPDMRPLRFRRVPFGRDVAFDPGGATASRIAMPHMLPSTVPSVSASAKLLLYRGRDTDFSAPPAQIRASPIKALGSYLECMTLNRRSGHGCCTRTGG